SVFLFQAEAGIRSFHVTGVQTCALPIFGTVPYVSYCCLGRLCKLAVENGVIPEPKIQPSASGGYTVLVYGEGADANDMTLPAAVMKWAGLHDHDPILDDDGDVAVRASEFNDCYGKTFREIAGLIRDRFGL